MNGIGTLGRERSPLRKNGGVYQHTTELADTLRGHLAQFQKLSWALEDARRKYREAKTEQERTEAIVEIYSHALAAQSFLRHAMKGY